VSVIVDTKESEMSVVVRTAEESDASAVTGQPRRVA
jgi:hypothetical protein